MYRFSENVQFFGLFGLSTKEPYSFMNCLSSLLSLAS